jgi:hypothetical protein
MKSLNERPFQQEKEEMHYLIEKIIRAKIVNKKKQDLT